MPIRVVLADDDAHVRQALRLTLEADARFLVAGETDSGHDVEEVLAETTPDVVLMDVHMPGGGPELCRTVSASGGAPVVVAVSANQHASTVRSMLRAGATGYLGKGQLGDDLCDLLARCARGHVVIAVAQARTVLEGWTDSSV